MIVGLNYFQKMKNKLFYVEFANVGNLYTEEKFHNFIKGAVLQNHDIKHFEVIQVDSRLTLEEALQIASIFGRKNDFLQIKKVFYNSSPKQWLELIGII